MRDSQKKPRKTHNQNKKLLSLQVPKNFDSKLVLQERHDHLHIAKLQKTPVTHSEHVTQRYYICDMDVLRKYGLFVLQLNENSARGEKFNWWKINDKLIK